MDENDDLSVAIEENQADVKAEIEEITEWQKLLELTKQNHLETMERLEKLETKLAASTELTPEAETSTELTPEAETSTELTPEAEIFNSSIANNQPENVGAVDHEKTLTRKQKRLAKKQQRKS